MYYESANDEHYTAVTSTQSLNMCSDSDTGKNYLNTVKYSYQVRSI